MLHQIGAGALGPVFRAYQPEPGRLVAVKLFRLDLPPERAHKLVAEFERLIAADLSHPGIAAPIGTGLSDVSPYLAQDFVTADSLDVVIRTGGSSSPADVARVAAQVAAALDFAASRDVFHGALHPRDVMLSADDVRITGLGVARALDAVQVATPVRRPYSPAERAVGGPWDGRADMFSFAALMFELLFGRRVSGSGDRAVVSLPEVPGVSRTALKRVFAKALSADPAGRFSSGAAFVDALQEAFARKETDDSRKSARLPLEIADVDSTSDAGEATVSAPASGMRLDLAADAPLASEPPAIPEPRIVPLSETDMQSVEELSVSEAVDDELQERQLHEDANEAIAEAQEVEARVPASRRRRKPAIERARRSIDSVMAEAADAVRPEDVVVPPIFTGSPAEAALEEAAVDEAAVDEAVPDLSLNDSVVPEESAAHDRSEPSPVVEMSGIDIPAEEFAEAGGGGHDAHEAAQPSPEDLQQVEAAAQGIEGWLEANERHATPRSVTPRSADELPVADIATVGYEHEQLDLQPHEHGTLFDDHPLDLRAAAPVVTHEIADEHADTAVPVDHDLHIDRGERSAAAFASMALETTRTAVWPMVLSFVVGGAVVLGMVILWIARDNRSDVPATASAPATAPTRIEDPPIVTEPPPAATVPATPPSAASASGSSASAPAAPPPAASPGSSQGSTAAATTPPSPSRSGPVAPVISEPLGSASASAPTPRRQPAAPPARSESRTARGRTTPERPATSAPSRQQPQTRAAQNARSASRPVAPSRPQDTRRSTPPAPAPVATVGDLRVESRPSGATVTLDGRRVGTTPLSLTGIDTGEHPISIEMQGFRRWATSVKIIGGQQVRIGASLEQ